MKKENNNEKEKQIVDSRLMFDAFTAGVKDGGLRSVASIYLIVCYIIANIKNNVTAQNIIDTMDEGMIANHFEVSDAISKLKSSKIIAENENGYLCLLQSDKEMIDLIENDLPLTIRDKSIQICQKIIAKQSFEKENQTSITECENGYNVTLHVSDNNKDFLTLTLWAPTAAQARIIKDKFISNPVRVYDNLIDSIFTNEN